MVLTPLQLFYSGIPAETTKPTYKLYLDKFFKYSKISHDEFLELERKDQESLFEQYIFYLRGITERTGKYQNSYNTMISPLKLFCTMNNVVINWARLYKMFPRTKKLSNQGAYDDDDLRLFLDHCDNLRDKAFIHFMGSTAVRIGEVCFLNIEDVESFEDGAIVTYYAGQKEEYKVCLTPEAYKCLSRYLETRMIKKPKSPLFATKKGIVERRLAQTTVLEFMKRIRQKVSPNEERDGKRKHKAPNNAYRKRLENIFADADVQIRYVNYLLDHNKAKQDPHYFRDIKNEKLWAQFKKAIQMITIDKSEQLKFENSLKDKKIVEYETKLKDELESIKAEQARQNQILKENRFAYLSCWVNDPDTLYPEEIQEYNKLIRELGIERCKKLTAFTEVFEFTEARLKAWKKGSVDWDLSDDEFNKFLKHPRKYTKDYFKNNYSEEELKELKEEFKELMKK